MLSTGAPNASSFLAALGDRAGIARADGQLTTFARELFGSGIRDAFARAAHQRDLAANSEVHGQRVPRR